MYTNAKTWNKFLSFQEWLSSTPSVVSRWLTDSKYGDGSGTDTGSHESPVWFINPQCYRDYFSKSNSWKQCRLPWNSNGNFVFQPLTTKKETWLLYGLLGVLNNMEYSGIKHTYASSKDTKASSSILQCKHLPWQWSSRSVLNLGLWKALEHHISLNSLAQVIMGNILALNYTLTEQDVYELVLLVR